MLAFLTSPEAMPHRRATLTQLRESTNLQPTLNREINDRENRMTAKGGSRFAAVMP